MYRSGESEYLINSSPCRLMDIQDILHDSGLGKDTHSIISQGKLDAILQSRPEERRSLIEEAADVYKRQPYALGTSPAENLVSALASRGLLAHGAIALFEMCIRDSQYVPYAPICR